MHSAHEAQYLAAPVKLSMNTVFPRIIAGAITSIFAPKGGDYSRESDYSREAIISNASALRRSHPKYFVLFINKEKISPQKKTVKNRCFHVVVNN